MGIVPGGDFVLHAVFDCAAQREFGRPGDSVGRAVGAGYQGIGAGAGEEDDPVDAAASTWTRVTHSMIWKDTVSSSRTVFHRAGAADSSHSAGAAHGGLSICRGGLSAVLFILRQDRCAVAVADSVYHFWHRRVVQNHADGDRSWTNADAGYVQHCEVCAARADRESVHAEVDEHGDVAYRVVFKQIMPQVINSVRLNLKPLALFLFAGEMIASADGLAYRIGIMRRHMGMDIIIPYLLWVAVLLFAMDAFLRFANRRLHPWF